MANIKETSINLVPDTVNISPDYFCTWQVQLFRCNNAGPQGQRDNMTEENIFGTGNEQEDRKVGRGWANHLYKDARRDLIYLLDDSWDIPIGALLKEKDPWYASQILAEDKFPSFYVPGEPFDAKRNVESMKKLSKKIKELGWKGLGGWICVEKSPLAKEKTDEEYWSERLKWANEAGWLYWKLDWGRDCNTFAVRKLITDLRFKYAPNLIAEQAIVPDMIPFADSYRTYDVFTLLAIPITLEKLAFDFKFDAEDGYLGYINCMDEVYTAAALGCAIDVTRHNMTGPLPDGRPDPSFPALHRQLKTKTDEVTRTVRWHRIAPAFSVNGKDTFIDENWLTDFWDVVEQAKEIEAWWKYKDGDHIERKGPARISRGLSPAEVTEDREGFVPYVVSALHPCGVTSIATLGRTQGRRYFVPRCDVVQDIKSADTTGVFGYYASLTLKSTAVKEASRILMQDLLSDKALDVTAECRIENGRVYLPGDLINTIGTSCNHEGDTSEPGLIVKIVND
ncbi:MAG: hypothetical protein IKU43_08755 [Clostridia bacterium]|nr:hypothetical protein [Clostridia bacterium]